MALTRGKTVAIIPARGGSKRVPKKNFLPLNGVPLISYTIRAAKQAQVFDKIVVSTDSREIKEIANSEGVDIDDRPIAMAGDHVTKVEVVREYLIRTDAAKNYQNVAALLPTCPFRTAADIKAAMLMFDHNRDESFLIGVTTYDFPPQLALSEAQNNCVEIMHSESYKTTRSQSIELRFHPNGSIYLATIEEFLKRGTFFNQRMLAYKMPAERSFDIDYPYQFEMAEVMMKRKAQHGDIEA